jgi:hypothetical protein
LTNPATLANIYHMNRIRRVGPVLEAAQPREYQVIYHDSDYGKMNKNREDIPWRVAARVFSIMESIARENGIEVKNMTSRPMQGDFVYEGLNGHFRKKGGANDEWMWWAEYVILMLDDDYWSLRIEFNLGKTERNGGWVRGHPAFGRRYSMFRCDDIRGIEAAVSDTIGMATAKSGEIFSAFTGLSDIFQQSY